MQNILQILLILIEVVSSFLLITVILIQKSKGGGLGGSAFGGGGNESMFGARAGNVLTKITIGLSIVFLANTLVLAFMFAGDDRDSIMDVMAPPIVPVEQATPAGVEDAASLPSALAEDMAEVDLTLPAELGTASGEAAAEDLTIQLPTDSGVVPSVSPAPVVPIEAPPEPEAAIEPPRVEVEAVPAEVAE